MLIDRTDELITVNLWGNLSHLEINELDIVIINGGRVSNFASGKVLNCGDDYCKVIINPGKELAFNILEFIDVAMSNSAA